MRPAIIACPHKISSHDVAGMLVRRDIFHHLVAIVASSIGQSAAWEFATGINAVQFSQQNAYNAVGTWFERVFGRVQWLATTMCCGEWNGERYSPGS
jgi:hypothetical protein